MKKSALVLSLPESDPPMTTPTGEPKQGFWKKFDAMPLWKQWAFILVAIVVVGVVIWLLPFIPKGGAAPK